MERYERKIKQIAHILIKFKLIMQKLYFMPYNNCKKKFKIKGLTKTRYLNVNLYYFIEGNK